MIEKLDQTLNEQTLVLLKPDAVARGLSGEILQRFERTGLTLVACKLIVPTVKILDGHFPKSKEWISGMGEKTLETYQEYGINPAEIFDSSEPYIIGTKILSWNYKYLTMGPVMALVFRGVHAVSVVRKLIGHTLPYKAMPGTIRGDYSINAPDLANMVGSACKNIVHASGTVEEACQEIQNWFNRSEILDWNPAAHFVHFVQGEFTTNASTGDNAMQYSEIEQNFNSLKSSDPRSAAEFAYALAMLYKQSGDDGKAQAFGLESIALFDSCSLDTIEECSSRNQFIGGIVIPDLIHQEVVRNRLQPISL